MKKMKKLLSMLLTVIMVLAMTAPSFADTTEGGKIIISNPKQGVYTLYKVFDVVYAEDKTDSSGYSYYTKNTNNDWITFLGNQGFTLQEVKDASGATVRYNVTDAANVVAAEFANALREKTNLLTKVDEKTVNSEETAALDFIVSALGYYFVDTTTGSLCNLTTTNPEVTIQDKNDVPFEKEIVTNTDGGVQIGDVISYKLTGKVADVTGFDEYNYAVADTMGAGLTYNSDSLKVKIGEVEVPVSDTATQGTNGFKISIPFVNEQGAIYTAGADIEITYTATVNSDAKAVVIENNATLTYGPNDNTQNITKKVAIYTSQIVIDKVKEGETTTKLAGAEFRLLNSENKYYKLTTTENSTAATVTWVNDVSEATIVTTDNNGAASFTGLKNGTYKLEEVKAPAGYNRLTDLVEVAVNGNPIPNEDGTYVVTSLTATAQVTNNTGSILPSTGGIGTTIFYAAGIILMAGAVFFVVRRKRA